MLLTTDSISSQLAFKYWKEYVCDVFVQLDVQSHAQSDFYGSIKSVDHGQIQFSKVCAQQQNVSRTRHSIAKSVQDYFLLSIQLEGSGRISQDGKTAVLHESDMCLYDSTRPYKLDFDTAFEQLVLRVPRQLAASLIPKSHGITASRISSRTGLGKILFDHYLNLYAENECIDRNSMMSMETMGLNLLQLYFDKSSELESDDSIMLLRAKNWIKENLFFTDFTIASMAKDMKCSRRLIYKVFENQQETPYAYIQSLRLEKAKSMLENDLYRNMNIHEIADACNFKSAAHFSSSFKKKYQQSPAGYRRYIMEEKKMQA